MKTSDFFFHLPEELIAQHPLEKRDASRLMVVSRANQSITHRHFSDLIDYLESGDTLVLNNSRVIPARLMGTAEGRTSPIEVVLLTDRGNGRWECLTRPGKKTREGTRLSFGDDLLTGTVASIDPETGNRMIDFSYDGVFLELLEKLGTMPLPPYIKEKLDDPERYQTIYSKTPGSAAAPTAGLHFTQDLLDKIAQKGVHIAYITLHVGLGTFRPVKVEDVTHHKMHAEYYSLDAENAAKINLAKQNGKRIVAVGTTTCRTLETIASADGSVSARSGWTDIFIYPGYTFRMVDALVTNFHLPESTLMMLVSAFASKDQIMHAYETAIQEHYRFFSFGDAMLIQ